MLGLPSARTSQRARAVWATQQDPVARHTHILTRNHNESINEHSIRPSVLCRVIHSHPWLVGAHTASDFLPPWHHTHTCRSLIKAPLPHSPLLSLCFWVTHWTLLGLPVWAQVRGYLPERDRWASGHTAEEDDSPLLTTKTTTAPEKNPLTHLFKTAQWNSNMFQVEDLKSKWRCSFLF